ncbi:MAG: enoyl-CoA hydratase/isomerase family protein [Bdellovibrionales bacterium]|nr:enoyl-CoA hydratase/isomerase family protein [Bdellovibrionales bacterium]
MELLNFDITDNGVATLTLNRPEVHNAFNDHLIQKMIDIFSNLDKKVRLVILTGNGKSFSAGADLNWMKSMASYSKEENFDDSKKLSKLFSLIDNCEVPVIGKINGHALGGGVGLVAVCDYAIGVDSLNMGMTEVRLGLVPAVISPYVINKIGESNARATFLSGERFSASQAMTMGLIHQIVSADKLDEAINIKVNEFLKAAPEASKNAKLLIKKVILNNETNQEDYLCNLISKLRVSDEGQEGMSALLEKRTPNW